MRKSLRIILSVALVAAILSVPAAGPIALAQAVPPSEGGTQPPVVQASCPAATLVGSGQLSYTADEIRGSELAALSRTVRERADVAPLLGLAQEQNYRLSDVQAYRIRAKAGQQGREVAFTYVLLELAGADSGHSAQLAFLDLGNRVVTGLGMISLKPNGYKLIDVYEVQQGKPVFTSHIDGEALAKRAGAQTVTVPDPFGTLQATPNPNCPMCMNVCNYIIGTGSCGAAGYFGCNAICAVIAGPACPWICAILLAMACGGVFVLSCPVACNGLGFCPG